MAGGETVLQEASLLLQSGDRYWLADLYRLNGSIALRQGRPDPERAEACFYQALEIARGQESRMLELPHRPRHVWRDMG
jgi:hypothetical protein